MQPDSISIGLCNQSLNFHNMMKGGTEGTVTVSGSDSDEYDIDLDETDEEEDDLTGQPLNPPVGVTKQGGRTNKGAHDRATNDSSDDDW
jgi:hypothetical protein